MKIIDCIFAVKVYFVYICNIKQHRSGGNAINSARKTWKQDLQTESLK